MIKGFNIPRHLSCGAAFLEEILSNCLQELWNSRSCTGGSSPEKLLNQILSNHSEGAPEHMDSIETLVRLFLKK